MFFVVCKEGAQNGSFLFFFFLFFLFLEGIGLPASSRPARATVLLSDPLSLEGWICGLDGSNLSFMRSLHAWGLLAWTWLVVRSAYARSQALRAPYTSAQLLAFECYHPFRAASVCLA